MSFCACKRCSHLESIVTYLRPLQYNVQATALDIVFHKLKLNRSSVITHNVKVSLYLGAQLLFFDFVAYFLFLSLR